MNSVTLGWSATRKLRSLGRKSLFMVASEPRLTKATAVNVLLP
jgi:hypothetical protein